MFSLFKHCFNCCNKQKAESTDSEHHSAYVLCESEKSSMSVESTARTITVKLDSDQIADNNSSTQHDFSLVQLPSKFSPENPPERILAFDIDDTLLNRIESTESKDTVLINEVEIKAILQYAAENNVMVGMVTARKLKDNLKAFEEFRYAMANTIITLLGKEYFSFIYYTNEVGKPLKNLALRHVFKVYYGQKFPLDKSKVCLADDDHCQTNRSLREGFSVIHVKVHDLSKENYLNKIKTFIDLAVARKNSVTKAPADDYAKMSFTL